ncbi:MAG: S41 family peptidase [Pseudomonadota bacterium]
MTEFSEGTSLRELSISPPLRMGLSALSALLLAACSGGGDGGPSPAATAPTATAPAPTTSGATTFTPGVFLSSEQFEAQCEMPRTGRDIEGNTFPDEAGSTLLENFWLRSWTNETYLWNDAVPDQDPAAFDNRLDYFDVLITPELTPSGKPLDDFHFSQPTDEFLASRNSAPRPRYGVSFVALSSTVPRDFRVRFTEPNSPASEVVLGQPNLVRGTRILEIDGLDFVNATDDAEVDALNAALFPTKVGETHTFVVQDPGSNDTRTITLTAANIAQSPVNRTSIIDTPTGRVGYVLFNTFSPFSSEEELSVAIEQLSDAGVTDLVLDMRYNGGGLLAVAAQLGYMVAGPSRTGGRDFERLRFNNDAGNTNPIDGSFNAPTPFFDQGLGFSLPNGAPLPTLNLPRVFVLSTESTCSASESVINSLRGIGVEVVLIGTTTCGKPFGFFPTDNCGETYFTIQFQGVNDIGFGDYADGFIAANSDETFGVRLPGCEVPDDFSRELGDVNEALLAAALQFREDGSCPPVPTAAGQTANGSSSVGAASGNFLAEPTARIAATDATELEAFLESNRDMRMPF